MNGGESLSPPLFCNRIEIKKLFFVFLITFLSLLVIINLSFSIVYNSYIQIGIYKKLGNSFYYFRWLDELE